MFLSLKQRRDNSLDPDDYLSYSEGTAGVSGGAGGGGEGEFPDINPLSPSMNSSAGVDLGAPSDLRPSPPMQATTTQDPTSVQPIHTAIAHNGPGYNPRGAPALTPGPIARPGSKRTTSSGIVDPFSSRKRQPKHGTGASFSTARHGK